jgi:hypothetical protein
MKESVTQAEALVSRTLRIARTARCNRIAYLEARKENKNNGEKKGEKNLHFCLNFRKHRADYNNNPPNAVAFMPAIASTSGRLHSEFIRLFFLQAHRETDLFFAPSGVQLPQSNMGGFFHFHRSAFSSVLK